VTDTTIERVETWYLRVPLPTPVVLGSIVIRQRDFVVVRVLTAGGVEGTAYSLTRGAPLDTVITDLLAPVVVGRDALDTTRRHEELSRAMVSLGPVGIVGRGISLLDICLWDVKGRLAGLPVHRLLGGYRTASPVMLVAPYAADGESDVAYAERLAPLAARGYWAIKLYPMADAAAMARRLATLRRVLGDEVRLMVDAAWVWRTAQEAITAVRQWEPYHLTWVEDPFPSSEWVPMKALADAVETPIAAGDEVSVDVIMERLAARRAVDVLRLDATSLGGFTGFAPVRHSTARRGFAISTHTYPEIHRHCTYAWPEVLPFEVFLPGSPTWGVSRFFRSEIDLAEGATEIGAPTQPGVGLDLDWGAVEALALRKASVPG
jgi:L-alanine-DL-glutamate epimerase-like enolase superfamily enzyme